MGWWYYYCDLGGRRCRSTHQIRTWHRQTGIITTVSSPPSTWVEMKADTKNGYYDNIEMFLIVWFAVFGFTALVFEPLYYFGCGWDGLSCPAAQYSSLMKHIQTIWHVYCQWDPLFYKPPLWLRVLCSIEVFLFGPLYCVTVYGLLYKLNWSPLAYCFSGALIYSTGTCPNLDC